MNCYLCQCSSFSTRPGAVRDAPDLKILECNDCGLVFLSSIDHIRTGFYEESGMHGSAPQSMDDWLKETAQDDARRFNALERTLVDKKVLDFGCGAGGFLSMAKRVAASAKGIELEDRAREHWSGQIEIHHDIESAGGGFDVVTAFHVVEHLPDPVAVLKRLGAQLAPDGRLIVEVPSSADALLTLYESASFQKFTYWSQHLYLFNEDTLRRVCEMAGLRVIKIEQFQRYPLSNHLHWLSKNAPGGHEKWAFLDGPELDAAYSKSLAAQGKCDTLIAHLEATGWLKHARSVN